MVQPAVQPPEVMPSMYGPIPRTCRAADLPGMVSVGVTELFPEMQKGYRQGEGVEETGRATRDALAAVNIERIRPEDTVNILCSEHGFSILEGLHYREMLKALGDAGSWGYYIHSGRIAFGCLENGKYDAFDLTVPSAYGLHDMVAKYFSGEMKAFDRLMNINPAIKAVVINQAWPGLPISDVPRHVPTVVVGRDQADMLNLDSTNPEFMKHAVIADTLQTAMEFTGKVAGTDKVIAFDGSFGNITASPSMAEDLIRRAPAVSRKVDQRLLPMCLKQRGIDPDEA